MHIDLQPNATPVYGRPYLVPQVHLATFKKELDHLVSRDWSTVPSQRYRTRTANFYNTKKDGTIRWVSDLRELNKAVKKTQYTLPIITDILKRRKGYI